MTSAGADMRFTAGKAAISSTDCCRDFAAYREGGGSGIQFVSLGSQNDTKLSSVFVPFISMARPPNLVHLVSRPTSAAFHGRLHCWTLRFLRTSEEAVLPLAEFVWMPVHSTTDCCGHRQSPVADPIVNGAHAHCQEFCCHFFCYQLLRRVHIEDRWSKMSIGNC